MRRRDEFDTREWELVEQLASQDRQARLVTRAFAGRTASRQPRSSMRCFSEVGHVFVGGWTRTAPFGCGFKKRRTQQRSGGERVMSRIC